MLALVGKPPPRQSKDVLQMRADSQHWRRIEWQRHAQRHKAARAPDQLRSAIDDCGHRIVAPLQDLAVVHQEGIGNTAEAHPCLFVINRNRLFAEVRRRHHQRLNAGIGKEKMLQRRVRQIHA